MITQEEECFPTLLVANLNAQVLLWWTPLSVSHINEHFFFLLLGKSLGLIVVTYM